MTSPQKEESPQVGTEGFQNDGAGDSEDLNTAGVVLQADDAPRTPEKWLSALFGNEAPGFTTICKPTPASTWETAFFAALNHEGAANRARTLAQDANVYYGLGLQPQDLGSKRRGKADDVVGIGALWMDFDIKGPNHKEPNLPTSRQDVEALLEAVPLKPTAIISTGGGIHAYWFLPNPWVFNSDEERVRAVRLSKAWQKGFIDRAAEKDWKLDNTADLARVLRLPGTLNHKSTPPVPVNLDRWTGERYAIEKLEEAAGVVPAAATVAPAPSGKRGGSRLSLDETPTASADRMAEECAWIAHCRDDAPTLREPEWYAMLSNVGRCSDGKTVAHLWSRPHPKYDAGETERKLTQALEKSGPVTCEYVRTSLGGSGHCAVCPHAGKVRSPVVLGLPGSDFAVRWAYVLDTLQFVDIEDGRRLSKEQFNDAFSHVLGDGAHRRMLANPLLAKVGAWTYHPGVGFFVEEDGAEKANLWRGGGVKPTPGDASPFLRHVEYLLPDDAVRSHVLNWLAFTVQHPAEKIYHAIVLQGMQGAGKSYLARVLKALHGAKNVHEVSTDEIHGDFTGWLEAKQVILVEELMAAGRLELANKLKPMITQEEIRINEKHVRPYRIKNVANFFCTTNHEDPIILERGDRRWFFYKSPAEPKEVSYYQSLEAWTEDSLGVIAHYLAGRDLSRWNPKAPPPMTADKEELIRAGLPPLQDFLLTRRDEEAWPFNKEVLTQDQVMTILPNSLSTAGPERIGRALRAIGVKPIGERRLPGRGKVKVYALQRAELWKQASQDALSAELGRTRAPRYGTGDL
ncbi:primase-helicase family protein [Azospirillum sp. sgz301742]